jgi:orotidine-5'-phosphate decarboxylase
MKNTSHKPQNSRERLIFALDVSDLETAEQLIDSLGDAVVFYKIGLEFFLSGHYFELADRLKKAGKKVFADLKLFDIPPTVGRAVAQLARRDVDFVTVHGNDAMLQAAVDHAGQMGVLAVTALTSLDRGDLDDLGFDCDVEALVLSRAKRALALGCAGVISSGLEVRALRQSVDDALTVICPGIRPVDNVDDQKRTMSASEAFAAGADYVVVGRPIRDAADPRQAALALQAEIAAYFK